MENQPINMKCADCGVDRGGMINLEEKNPVLRCFQCAQRGVRTASGSDRINITRQPDRRAA